MDPLINLCVSAVLSCSPVGGVPIEDLVSEFNEICSATTLDCENTKVFYAELPSYVAGQAVEYSSGRTAIMLNRKANKSYTSILVHEVAHLVIYAQETKNSKKRSHSGKFQKECNKLRRAFNQNLETCNR